MDNTTAVLCRSLENIVESTIQQSRRCMDMVSLDQSSQIDRINAEYVAQIGHAPAPLQQPPNGYIEEPPAAGAGIYPEDIP